MLVAGEVLVGNVNFPVDVCEGQDNGEGQVYCPDGYVVKIRTRRIRQRLKDSAQVFVHHAVDINDIQRGR